MAIIKTYEEEFEKTFKQIKEDIKNLKLEQIQILTNMPLEDDRFIIEIIYYKK